MIRDEFKNVDNKVIAKKTNKKMQALHCTCTKVYAGYTALTAAAAAAAAKSLQS